MSLVGQALAIAREIQDGAAAVGLTLTLATLHADAGRDDEAAQHLLAVLPRSAHIPGNSRATAWVQVQLGSVLMRLGRPEEASTAYEEATALFAGLGCVDGPAVLRTLKTPQRMN